MREVETANYTDPVSGMKGAAFFNITDSEYYCRTSCGMVFRAKVNDVRSIHHFVCNSVRIAVNANPTFDAKYLGFKFI